MELLGLRLQPEYPDDIGGKLERSAAARAGFAPDFRFRGPRLQTSQTVGATRELSDAT